MNREAVLTAPTTEPPAPFTAQIYAATANASFAEKIAAALNAEGIEVVTGDYVQSGAAAVIVVWSGASVGSKKLIAAAHSPLSASAIIPVSIGRVEAPDAFRHLQPVDLAGWTGSTADPRWRFVVDELRRMATRERASRVSPAIAQPLDKVGETANFESWFDAAFVEEAEARAAVRAKAAPEQAVIATRRPNPKPLVVVAAAAGVTIFLAFAGLTLLRGSGAPQATTAAAPATPQLGQAQIAPAPAPQARETPPPAEAADPAPVPADAAGEDRIAALIAENSGRATEPVAPEILDIPDTDGPAHFRDCADCPELSRVPAGSFRMGPGPDDAVKPGEGPAVEVAISKPFAIARTETTVGEWKLCVADSACPALPGVSGARTPAVNVSWRDAQAYAAWLSKKTGKRYRLPSEAEWEYAARAGAETAFAFGGALSAHDAAFDGTLPYRGDGGASLRSPKPVASYADNAFGLFDMHGNAWEWTADCWAVGHAGAPTDGSPRGGACAQRVLKGGAWNTGGWRLRAAHRIGKPETAREYDNGFRVARDLP